MNTFSCHIMLFPAVPPALFPEIAAPFPRADALGYFLSSLRD